MTGEISEAKLVKVKVNKEDNTDLGGMMRRNKDTERGL